MQRRAVKEIKEPDAAALNGHKLQHELDTLVGGAPADFATRQGALAWELRFAEAVARWLDDEATHPALRLALEYAAWATLSPAGRRSIGAACCSGCRTGSTCTILCWSRRSNAMGSHAASARARWRARDGFGLTDAGTDLAGALDQANYCIWR